MAPKSRRSAGCRSLATGELVGAIAMTEPGTGSDLQGVKTTAKRDGNHYVINGSKTFITNGGSANSHLVVAKTDPGEAPRAFRWSCVETDEVEGFRRGRMLDKMASSQRHLRTLLRRREGADLAICSAPRKARASSS